MVGEELFGLDLEVSEEHPSRASVLTGDYISLAENTYGSQSDIFQISYRGGYEIENPRRERGVSHMLEPELITDNIDLVVEILVFFENTLDLAARVEYS